MKGPSHHRLYTSVAHGLIASLNLGIVRIDQPVAAFARQLIYPGGSLPESYKNDHLLATGAISLGIVFQSQVNFWNNEEDYAVKLSFRKLNTKQKMKYFIPINAWNPPDYMEMMNNVEDMMFNGGRASIFNVGELLNMGNIRFHNTTIGYATGIDIVFPLNGTLPDDEYILKIKLIKKSTNCPPEKSPCWGSWKNVNYFALPVRVDANLGSCTYDPVRICQEFTETSAVGKWPLYFPPPPPSNN